MTLIRPRLLFKDQRRPSPSAPRANLSPQLGYPPLQLFSLFFLFFPVLFYYFLSFFSPFSILSFSFLYPLSLHLEVRPFESSYRVWGSVVIKLPQWGLGRSPSRNQIWWILTFKMWHLTATNLIIFHIINWSNLVQFKQCRQTSVGWHYNWCWVCAA